MVKKEVLIERYNIAVNKLNELEGDSEKMFELLTPDYNGRLTEDDCEYMETHYKEMLDRYKEFKLGKFSLTPYEYGKQAFKNGKKRLPYYDNEFLEAHIAGLQVGEGIEPMNQWLKGWDDANLAEPITGDK